MWSKFSVRQHYQFVYIWVKSCRTGKKCLKCPNFTLTQRLALSKPSILQTWVFCPAGILLLAHPHKNFHLPGLPGNVCRKGLKFPENPGNLYFQKTAENRLKSGKLKKIRPLLRDEVTKCLGKACCWAGVCVILVRRWLALASDSWDLLRIRLTDTYSWTSRLF